MTCVIIGAVFFGASLVTLFFANRKLSLAMDAEERAWKQATRRAPE